MVHVEDAAEEKKYIKFLILQDAKAALSMKGLAPKLVEPLVQASDQQTQFARQAQLPPTNLMGPVFCNIPIPTDLTPEYINNNGVSYYQFGLPIDSGSAEDSGRYLKVCLFGDINALKDFTREKFFGCWVWLKRRTRPPQKPGQNAAFVPYLRIHAVHDFCSSADLALLPFGSLDSLPDLPHYDLREKIPKNDGAWKDLITRVGFIPAR